MDLATELKERYKQLASFESGLPKRYVDLQCRYESQQQTLVEYKTKAHYWEAQFSQIKSREGTLLSEIEELRASLKKREQQLFGRRSEKTSKKSEGVSNNLRGTSAKKKRGQQAGAQGHGRRDHSQLPVVDEEVSLVDASCPCCHLPYEELQGREDSDVLEMINVKAYCRAIHRKKYKRRCRCKANNDPMIVSAPVTEKVIPKSKLGVSIWVKLLLEKYAYQQPLNRTLEQLSHYGLSLSSGTVTGGFKRLLPLFVPVYDAIVNRSLSAQHWHADETGWKVFEAVEGKKK